MRVSVAAVCTMFLVACGGGGSETPSAPKLVLTSVMVALSRDTIPVGQTTTATASGLDQNGAAIGAGTVTWTASPSTVATVSASGTVTGVGAGQALITATAGGKQGQRTITVTPAPVATVAVTPPAATIQIGASQQLTATTRAASGDTLVGRVITWATSDSTIATVSPSGLVTGVALGAATVTATSEGKSGTATMTVSGGASSISLATAGQSVAFLDSVGVNVSLNLPAGSQFLIAVVNTDPSSTLLEDFTLDGSLAASSASRGLPEPARAAPPVERQAMYALPTQTRASLARLQGLEQRHLTMLAANRDIYARYGNPGPLWAKARAERGRNLSLAATVAPAVGTVNRVYVRNTLAGSCTAVDSIGARTVAVGQHVIVVADTNQTAWPPAYRPDSAFYQAFANEYDQVTYPTLLAYIGDPLAYDGSLSGLGKVTVVLTPVLNNLAGPSGGGMVVAFVSPCDFFPFAATGANADFSNQTEMVYSLVPSATGYDVASWEAELRATAAHESKHIVSIADRIRLGSPTFEDVWLEEGLAQVSSEIWERHFNQATWRGNATFVQTVACEIDLGAGAPCDIANDLPLALVASHLPFTFSYLANESAGGAEGLGVDTPSNYGAGWTLARWTIDQYAGSAEGPFIQSLINTTQTGLANLASHSGQSIALLLTYWNVATAVFQTPAYTAADARTTFPSFNLADIFHVGQTGLTCSGVPCGLFTASGNPVYPVQPIAFAAGPFSRTVTGVPGTSAAFFLLTSPSAGIEALQLLSGSGGALPAGSGLRVAILRVQ